jgi:hypothetical protein
MANNHGSLVSVTRSVPFAAERPHPLDGAALCVVRTFLIPANGGTATGWSAAMQNYLNLSKDAIKLRPLTLYFKKSSKLRLIFTY